VDYKHNDVADRGIGLSPRLWFVII